MDSRFFRAALLGFSLLASAGVTALAQTNETPVSSTHSPTATAGGTGVTGRVITPSGQPVAHASVVVRSLDEPAPAVPEMAVMTGADGRYFWPVPEGRWEVTVFALDGATQSKQIAVAKPRSATLDFTLAP
jgi:hypothetical protein